MSASTVSTTATATPDPTSIVTLSTLNSTSSRGSYLIGVRLRRCA